jgi:diacylglycerol kinase (ATP)
MYYFIVNPVAGAGRAKKNFNKIKSYLHEKNINFTYEYTKRPDHASELAREAAQKGFKRIICIGGDGTAAEMAEGLLGTDSALGVIPSGTGNDFARSLGMAKNVEKAFAQLMSAGQKSIDVGCMGDKHFLNSAGIGFDVDVVLNTRFASKAFGGMFAYVLGIIGALIKLKRRKLIIKAGDRVIEKEVLLVVVANGKYFGGGMKVCPHASMQDGKLDVIVIDMVKRLTVIRLLPKFISGKHVEFPIVQYFKSDEVEIQGTSDFMQYDGRVIPYEAGKYGVKRDALKVLCPVN